MKNRTEHKNYGKGVLSFGKYKGKTMKQVINEGDYGYIVWLNDNVARITVSPYDYNYCKNRIAEEQAMHEATMESEHGDWGCRD